MKVSLVIPRQGVVVVLVYYRLEGTINALRRDRRLNGFRGTRAVKVSYFGAKRLDAVIFEHKS